MKVVDIEDLLLQKEKFWIGSFITQYRGLNYTRDWNRNKRIEQPK